MLQYFGGGGFREEGARFGERGFSLIPCPSHITSQMGEGVHALVSGADLGGGGGLPAGDGVVIEGCGGVAGALAV